MGIVPASLDVLHPGSKGIWIVRQQLFFLKAIWGTKKNPARH